MDQSEVSVFSCRVGVGWDGDGVELELMLDTSHNTFSDNFMDNDGAPDIERPKSIMVRYRNFINKRHSYTKSGRGQHNLKSPGKPLLTVLLEGSDGTQRNYGFISFKKVIAGR